MKNSLIVNEREFNGDSKVLTEKVNGFNEKIQTNGRRQIQEQQKIDKKNAKGQRNTPLIEADMRQVYSQANFLDPHQSDSKYYKTQSNKKSIYLRQSSVKKENNPGSRGRDLTPLTKDLIELEKKRESAQKTFNDVHRSPPIKTYLTSQEKIKLELNVYGSKK